MFSQVDRSSQRVSLKESASKRSVGPLNSPEMRVFHVCDIELAQLPSSRLLLLRAHTRGSSSSIAALILPNVGVTPDDNEDKIEGKTDGASNGAGDIAWGIHCSEDF
jgi:hypothetical protein